MPERRYRVLALATHPVQYMAPLFRRMAVHPAIDLQVAYCTLRGAEASHDPEFGANIQWDVPLLDGYSWSHLPNRGSGKESFFGLYNPGLSEFINTGNYDAILCYVAYVRSSFWIAYTAASESGAAFLFGTDAVSLDPLDQRMWKRTIKRLLWPLLFRMVNQVLASSSSTRELMVSLGIPPHRITLTPSTVDNEWWSAKAAQVDRTTVRASWGVTENDVVFLFCAKLQPWKRPLDLLRAFAKVGQTNSLLVFAGEGPLRPQLEKEAAELRVASRVRFLGFVNQSQLPQIYKGVDLMVLPSSHENFGFVVNEAMCCGCPVAVSDQVGAGPDLVAPVNPGFIFPAGDVEALATLMSGVLSDPAQLREWSRRGLARMQTWSPECNIASTLEAVRIAVSRKRRDPTPPIPDFPSSQVAPAATRALKE